jgi:hypothetical protein
VAQDAEVDLRELITARRAELELQAEKLSQQLQGVRDELEELTVAERSRVVWPSRCVPNPGWR